MGIKYCSIWKRLLHSHRELSPETIFLSPTVLKTSIHTWIHYNLYKLVLEVALEILSPESHLGAEHFYSSFSALWGLPVIIDASVLPFLEPLIRIMFCWELVWWPSSFYSLPNCRGWENDSFMSMIHLPPGTCSIMIVPRVSHNLWWPEHSWVWVQAKIICTMLHAWLQLITKALSNRLQEGKRPPPPPAARPGAWQVHCSLSRELQQGPRPYSPPRAHHAYTEVSISISSNRFPKPSLSGGLDQGTLQQLCLDLSVVSVTLRHFSPFWLSTFLLRGWPLCSLPSFSSSLKQQETFGQGSSAGTFYMPALNVIKLTHTWWCSVGKKMEHFFFFAFYVNDHNTCVQSWLLLFAFGLSQLS